MNQLPLRYRISNWTQLVNCKSNASRDLRIEVTNFIQNDKLRGLRIAVVHTDFGTLFATIIDPSGDIVVPDYVHTEDAITPATILNEIAKFGFYVTVAQHSNLSGQQIQYLMTLRDLHFDKLRRVSIESVKGSETDRKTIVIAFKIESNPQWLDNKYLIRKKELEYALYHGTAINISEISETQHYDWSWLDFVANIDDIIRDNSSIRPDYSYSI